MSISFNYILCVWICRWFLGRAFSPLVFSTFFHCYRAMNKSIVIICCLRAALNVYVLLLLLLRQFCGSFSIFTHFCFLCRTTVGLFLPASNTHFLLSYYFFYAVCLASFRGVIQSFLPFFVIPSQA